jgi:hypothetical protein
MRCGRPRAGTAGCHAAEVEAEPTGGAMMHMRIIGWLTATSVWAGFLLAIIQGIVAWERDSVPEEAGQPGGLTAVEKPEPAQGAALHLVA